MLSIHCWKSVLEKIMQFTLIMLLCGHVVCAAESFPPSPTLFANTLELGDIQQAKKWLDLGLPVDFEGSRIGTGLHIAAWEGNIALMELYLNRGAHVDLLNHNNETPLALAAWRGQKNAMDFLIQQGASINVPHFQWSPLHYAVFSGQKKMVSDLIQQGADVNALSSNGSTALMMAVYEGRSDLIDTLLQAGASTQIRNDRNESAIDWAMRKNRVDLVKKMATPEELAQALSKPKAEWQPMKKSLASTATLEKLLKMREVLRARGQNTASIDRRIAGERKAIIDRDFDAGIPKKSARGQTLEIRAQKKAPEKQQIQIKSLPLSHSKRAGKPAPLPPKSAPLRNF